MFFLSSTELTNSRQGKGDIFRFTYGQSGAIFLLDSEDTAQELPRPANQGYISGLTFSLLVVEGYTPGIKNVVEASTRFNCGWAAENQWFVHHAQKLPDPWTWGVRLEKLSSGTEIILPFTLEEVYGEGAYLYDDAFTQTDDTVLITSDRFKVGGDYIFSGHKTSTPPDVLFTTVLFYLPNYTDIRRVEWIGRVFTPLLNLQPEAHRFIWDNSSKELLLLLPPGVISEDAFTAQDDSLTVELGSITAP